MCQHYTLILKVLSKNMPKVYIVVMQVYQHAMYVGRQNQCGTNDLILHESQLGIMCGFVFVLRIRRYGKEFANRANGARSWL